MNNKEKQKKFVSLLKELDEKYKILERSHDTHTTNEILHFFHSILSEYENELPKEIANNIDVIFKATDIGPAQLKDMMLNVRNSIQQSVNAMSTTTSTVPSTLIIKLIIIAAVGGTGIYGGSIIAFPVDIYISNHGCLPISAGQNLPIPVGVKLPSSPIRSGETGSGTLPRVTVTIGANTNGVLAIGVLGINFPIQLSGTISDVQFDGVSVVDHPQSFNLGEKQQHQLNVFCK